MRGVRAISSPRRRRQDIIYTNVLAVRALSSTLNRRTALSILRGLSGRRSEEELDPPTHSLIQYWKLDPHPTTPLYQRKPCGSRAESQRQNQQHLIIHFVTFRVRPTAEFTTLFPVISASASSSFVQSGGYSNSKQCVRILCIFTSSEALSRSVCLGHLEGSKILPAQVPFWSRPMGL